MALEHRINNAESGGRTHAKNPRSSAFGPGQFIDSTWLAMINRYRPDLAEGRSRADVLALRTDTGLNEEMTRNYSQENASFLRARGIEPTDENLSLAHFAGPAGAADLIANPDKPAASILSPAAIEANPFLKDWTAQKVVSWAGNRIAEKPASLSPARAGGSPTSSDAPRAQPSTENTAVLPFLASLFSGAGAAGAAGAGAGGLSSLASLFKGGDLAGMFGAESGANSGGLLSGLFPGAAGGPAPGSPAGGAMAASGMQAGGGGGMGDMLAKMGGGGGKPLPPVTLAPPPSMAPLSARPVDLSGMQRLMASRPQLGNVGMNGVGMLR
jgi:hypothetical protein